MKVKAYSTSIKMLRSWWCAGGVRRTRLPLQSPEATAVEMINTLKPLNEPRVHFVLSLFIKYPTPSFFWFVWYAAQYSTTKEEFLKTNYLQNEAESVEYEVQGTISRVKAILVWEVRIPWYCQVHPDIYGIKMSLVLSIFSSSHLCSRYFLH